jgi:hypothetical protein
MRERKGFDVELEGNENLRLSPDSIAKSYQYLVSQDSSAMTWELDRESSSDLFKLRDKY